MPASTLGAVSIALPDSPEERAVLLRNLDEGFNAYIPHNRALGLRFTDFGPDRASMTLPYAPDLVGNPETGVLHGGAITSLVDAACGAAVFMALGGPGRIATLDLRIDYLRHATPGRDVTAETHCYKLTHNIAFVRGIAHDGDAADPIASAAGAFAVFSDEQRRAAEGKNR